MSTGNTKTKAKLYKDRDSNALTKYMFISYSHKDEAVNTILQRLYDMGAEFWYDDDLRLGENWKDAVKTVLDKDACKGVLFIVSTDYILSDACRHEVEEFLALNGGEGGKKRAAAVLLFDYAEAETKKDKVDALLDSAFKQTTRNDKLFDVAEKNFKTLISNNDVIYEPIPREGNLTEESYDKIYSFFKNNGCVTETSDTLEVLARDRYVTRETEDGCTYYQFKFGKIGTKAKGMRDATWVALDYDGTNLYAILKGASLGSCCLSLSDNRFEKICGDDLDTDWNRYDVNTVNYLHLEFTEQERARLSEIRYLSPDERVKYDDYVSWAVKGDFDDEADGYFFVAEGTNKFFFADRFSTDVFKVSYAEKDGGENAEKVYNSVWKDEVASVIPVIARKIVR